MSLTRTMPNTNKFEPERVAMRREYDPFMEIEKVMCVFPDDRACFGRLCCLTMWFDGHGTAWFEPYMECDYSYYLSLKPLKDMEMAEKCKKALEEKYGGSFKIVQKIMWRR